MSVVSELPYSKVKTPPLPPLLWVISPNVESFIYYFSYSLISFIFFCYHKRSLERVWLISDAPWPKQHSLDSNSKQRPVQHGNTCVQDTRLYFCTVGGRRDVLSIFAHDVYMMIANSYHVGAQRGTTGSPSFRRPSEGLSAVLNSSQLVRTAP